MPDGSLNDSVFKIQDYIASDIYGYPSYAAASMDQKADIRQFLDDFFGVVGSLDTVIQNINTGLPLTESQQRILETLFTKPSIMDEFVKHYVYVLGTYGDPTTTGASTDKPLDADSAVLYGDKLYYLVNNVYKKYRDQYQIDQQTASTDSLDYIREQFKQFSIDPDQPFTPAFDYLDSFKVFRDNFLLRDGKFRQDSAPRPIDEYQCRIGCSTFFVPPTSIQVSQVFKTSSLGGILRQSSTPKMNMGHSETQISMTLYFPNHETIWGFNGDKADFNIYDWDPQPIFNEDLLQIYGQGERPSQSLVSDETIDYYLSSLRGLITQFKYAPFLPVKNIYLNRTYDITAVAMLGMTVSTLPDYPFAVAVNLQLAKFNYGAYMPMLDDFEQAIHWGKYRQYMGRAASRLDAKVNQGFLVTAQSSTDDTGTTGPNSTDGKNPTISAQTIAVYEGELIPRFDKVQDITDGRYFDLYYPISTPSRIFAPDTTDFRQPGEDETLSQSEWGGFLGILGYNVVDTPVFDFFQFDTTYRNTSLRKDRKVLFDWLQSNRIALDLMSPANEAKFIDYIVTEGRKTGAVNPSNEGAIRDDLKQEWFYMIYELLLNDNPRFQALINSRRFQNSKYTINEWKVPMDKLYIDWSSCIVRSINVSLSNNYATQQVQLQDEPTYQHLGSGDSMVSVSMVVIGEDNLLRFRRVFDHINGLARLEKAHGVLGFLGIKNVLTALCGIKYALPINFEVDTVPNYPHVYNVMMSFVDFDVMQQEREQLSSDQQKELVDNFGKRNPFLRLKQCWTAFSAYPDMPLDIRDETNKIVGHFDPDWYFRSFQTTNSDKDLFNWGFDTNVVQLIKSYAELKATYDNATDQLTRVNLSQELTDMRTKIAEVTGSGGALPPGWQWKDGQLVPITDAQPQEQPEPQHIQYLGAFDDKDPSSISFIAFFDAGYFMLGEEKVQKAGPNGQVVGTTRTYSMGMSYFSEDLASKNMPKTPAVTGSVPYAEYQHEYINGADSANKQYESIMQDYAYRSNRGRMIRAFPTYMLWLIDEGGRFAGIKLFDNFYGLNSVVDFSVVQSEDALSDTLVLRLSNIYQKLTTPYQDVVITEDDPLYNTPVGRAINIFQNRERNLRSGLTDDIIELNSIRLKPGVRIHLRMGYSANPNALQTVFNGVIAEVQPGDIMTIIAQSDAVEFTGFVNTVNKKGDTGTLAGGIDTGFWLCEPRDLIVRLLSMGTSNFKEWMAWGSKGVLFSDSRFGIRHFGTILYEEMTKNARIATQARVRTAATSVSDIKASDETGSAAAFTAMLGDEANQLNDISSITGLSSLFNGTLIQIGYAMWVNSFAQRDYEVFKRNIYPGNGLGIAQFMGGDLLDAGITLTSAKTFYSQGSDATSYGGTSTGDTTVGSVGVPTDKTVNTSDITYFQNAYDANQGITTEGLVELLSDPNSTADPALSKVLNTDNDKSKSLLESLFSSVGQLGDSLLDIQNYSFDLLDKILPGNPISSVYKGLDTVVSTAIFHPWTSIQRLIHSPLAKVLGFGAEVEDDDLPGYDEVSFRAQTYMKTVWDLFKTCAALLPNYIVAVRPFEDRSTLFYGKPHWLYTSGVIPVTTGIPHTKDAKPELEGPDSALQDLLMRAKQATSGEFERLQKLSEQTDILKNIMDFTVNDSSDPYDPTAVATTGVSTDQQKLDLYTKILGQLSGTNGGLSPGLDTAIKSVDLTSVPPEQLETLLTQMVFIDSQQNILKKSINYADMIKTINAYGTDQNVDKDIVAYLNDLSGDGKVGDKHLTNDQFIELLTALDRSYQTSQKEPTELDVDTSDYAQYQKDLAAGTVDTTTEYGSNATLLIAEITSFAKNDADRQKLIDFYKRDPITFAFQFGWKFRSIPISYDPSLGYGYDKVGILAVKTYNTINSDRTLGEANNIWSKMRNEFRSDTGGDPPGDNVQGVHDTYNRLFPEKPDQFDSTMDLFLKFLWEDPYNRGWVVAVANKKPRGADDYIIPGGQTGQLYDLDVYRKLWEVFLSEGDVTIDSDNIVHAPAARRYMEQNAQPGRNADNIITSTVEDITDWFDNSIGKVVGLITDTISGFISSIRLSLAQIGNGLAQASKMQVQANVLNSIFNDSIYYQEGDANSILRLVDNPFTREYGEPVIEIREPFQRLHYISSFDSILDNQIKENIGNIATVVTAVSDGAHPVTVHFDKGVPPDRQIEKVVETGLFWDNTYGSGLFGFLQPLLHPLEVLRGYTKMTTGSSDELSSRRVALAALKESLQDIYSGEITILGNSDIRPHDLLYVADVYERMYGMVEVEQVIHHFSPETGFVTAITPNAMVTVNDPARWTLSSWLWSKMTSYNLRDDVRSTMAIKAERNVASASQEITDDQLYQYFGTQLNGAVQWTQGNTAIIRDIGAYFAGGGIKGLSASDDAMTASATATIDIGLGLAKTISPIAGGIIGGVVGNIPGVVAGVAGGWAISDLLWKGWQWVKDNLLDQHGCYISYLNKDGQPMDAGLSYFQGVAVGTNHTIQAFPQIMGVSAKVNVTEDGHYRITTNDLLSSLGWSEIETMSIYKDTSIFVNNINSQILKLAGRSPDDVVMAGTDNYYVVKARVLDPNGETIPGTDGQRAGGVTDGDTLNVQIIDGGGGYPAGQTIRVRLSAVNAYELEHKDSAYTPVNEATTQNDPNDLGRLAYEYLVRRFSQSIDRYVVLRIDKNNQYDGYSKKNQYGQIVEPGRTIAIVFANAPLGTDDSKRLDTLAEIAGRNPAVPWDGYLEDGRPYTLNWELVMTGYGNVDMRESLWNTGWRNDAIYYQTGVQ